MRYVIFLFVCAFVVWTLPVAGQEQPSAPPAAAQPKLDLTPDASGNLSEEQMRELVRAVGQNFQTNYRKRRDYTYIWHDVDRKLDGKGQVKSTESKTYEVMRLYGEPVIRLIEKNDKPLTREESAKEEERIQKLADKRKNESDEQRRKREAQEEKTREKDRAFVSDVAEAYNFRFVGSETLNGRDAWVIAGEPRPDFHAQENEDGWLAKLHGKLWIDKSEMQLVKVDVSVVDTVAFGWVLARVHAGSHLVYEQTRVNDEVWLPLHYEGNIGVRVFVFKNDNEEAEGTYRDYKKFRTSTKIIGMGEVKEQKPQEQK
jgi:hypothetical protein